MPMEFMVSRHNPSESPEDATHDLELDPLPVEFNGSNLEIDTDSRNERGRPCVVAETKK